MKLLNLSLIFCLISASQIHSSITERLKGAAKAQLCFLPSYLGIWALNSTTNSTGYHIIMHFMHAGISGWLYNNLYSRPQILKNPHQRSGAHLSLWFLGATIVGTTAFRYIREHNVKIW